MLKFEWDDAKARSDLRKHGVSFEQAATGFGDPLAYTFADPDHSVREARFITIGQSNDRLLAVVAHAERGPGHPHHQRPQGDTSDRSMSKVEDMRAEYRREDLGKGVRGKYLRRYKRGTNLVLLDDRVARAFPTSEAVNDALLGLLALAEKARPAARASRKRSAS